MNIHTIIKSKLQNTSKEVVVKSMNYNSTKKGLETLKSFLKHADLNSWFNSGYYDFKYTPNTFFIELCKVLVIHNGVVAKALQNQKVYSEEMSKFKNTYIFVNTNFIRKSEPIFALAFCESSRRIGLPAKELIFKTDTEIISKISSIIKKHYLLSNGTIGIWCKIENYVYNNKNAKVHVFDKNGIIVDEEEVYETKAILTVRGKEICQTMI